MPKTAEQQGFERTIGELVGTVGGVKTAVDTLARRFDEHMREHRQGWLWVFPTIISLATLAVLIFTKRG